jgi:hypothetical protein
VSRRSTILPLAVTLGLYALAAGAMLIAGKVPSRAAFDSKLYHLPTIDGFAKTWPAIDPWDYLSATTPGYHWLLAGVMKLLGGLTPVLVVNAAITAALFGLAARLVARLARHEGGSDGHGGWMLATLLCLPLLANNYLLVPGVALLPDGAGWLLVLAMMALALRGGAVGATLALGGLILLATVLTRQLHVWTGGLLVLAAWMGGEAASRREGGAGAKAGGVARVLMAFAACVPAGLALLLFVRYWEGLVPPRFQGQYPPRGIGEMLLSPAPAFVLALAGAMGVFFVGFWWKGLARLWREQRAMLVGVAAASVAVAAIPPTTFDYFAGRRTGLWNLAEQFPTVGGRTSTLIVGLAGLGGVTLAGFATLLERRTRVILLCTLLGYAIVMTASAEVWQRYVEPIVLIVLTLMSAAVQGRVAASTMVRMARVIGLVLLTLACAAVTIRTFQSGVESWSDPAPAPMTSDHVGPPPPVVLEAPAKPAGKAFW